MKVYRLGLAGAVSQHQLHLTPPQEYRQPANRHGAQAADGHAEPIVQHLAQGTDGSDSTAPAAVQSMDS